MKNECEQDIKDQFDAFRRAVKKNNDKLGNRFDGICTRTESTYFNNLIKVYIRIYKASIEENAIEQAFGEIDRFDLLNRLYQGPYIGDSKRDIKLKKISICMDKISKEWDKIAEIRHPIVKREIVFFLTYFKEEASLDKEDNYAAKLFNAFTPPYDRLISLSINKNNNKIDIRPILHEMGHYIGFRKRIERQDKLKELICCSVFGKIYRICLNSYDNIPYDDKPALFFDICAPIGISRKNYCLEVIRCCYYIYLELKTYIQQEYENRIDEIEDQKEKYICQYFAREYAKIILPAIDRFLSKAEILNAIKQKYELTEVFSDVLRAISILEKDHLEGDFSEIFQVLNCIEEPTADCFMINMCRMKLKEYIKLVLDSSYAFWINNQGGERTPEEFCDFMAAPDHRMRYLAICKAMSTKKDPFHFVSNNLLWRGHKASCIKKACIMLSDMYMKSNRLLQDEDLNVYSLSACGDGTQEGIVNFSQNILNPQRLISDYIKEIMREYENELNIYCGKKEIENTTIKLYSQSKRIKGLRKEIAKYTNKRI